MSNESATSTDVRKWLVDLHRVEKVAQEFRQPGKHALDSDAREARRARLPGLLKEIPLQHRQATGSRFVSGRSLVAPMNGKTCTGCHTSIPSGDYSSLLAENRLVSCQYCGVFLYIDEATRMDLAAKIKS